MTTLPSIRQHLGGGLHWVVTGYTLMFSALPRFGGSVADRAAAGTLTATAGADHP